MEEDCAAARKSAAITSAAAKFALQLDFQRLASCFIGNRLAAWFLGGGWRNSRKFFDFPTELRVTALVEAIFRVRIRASHGRGWHPCRTQSSSITR
jgi:hypothetical protein